jgi:hypothetical protein
MVARADSRLVRFGLTATTWAEMALVICLAKCLVAVAGETTLVLVHNVEPKSKQHSHLTSSMLHTA